MVETARVIPRELLRGVVSYMGLKRLDQRPCCPAKWAREGDAAVDRTGWMAFEITIWSCGNYTYVCMYM